ncbi:MULTISPECIES: MBL fold metallo-hydrolase [Psychrobacter]|uniref:MBL fold metallo-hydrolase n=1 Tax=Psychrobacter TaxID=497 RepID=UPI00146E0A6D|nr:MULTISPECIES: MBL fold metallo-hydrolase [Psychrobacter]
MMVHSFLHQDSKTFSHILVDSKSELQVCAVIDPVLDFDGNSGTTSTESIDQLIAFIQEAGWQLEFIIETHAHADHLSAAAYLKQVLGGSLVIGRTITQVQKIFKQIYNLDTSFRTDASQFDLLLDDGDTLKLGSITINAIAVPGHTPADMAYLAVDGDDQLVFVGDTLFAPDVGTARCDFPGGDAATLFDSIQKLLALKEDTVIYLCHDYPPTNRDYCATSSVGEQKRRNIHVQDGIDKLAFIAMREARDRNLDMPKLIIPAVQVNIDAGNLPDPEANGIRYLKVPLNVLGNANRQ